MIILNYSNWDLKKGVPKYQASTSQAQKKRRMLCIVVSCLPAVSERLMLLDYQIGLNFASGVESWNVGETDIESTTARFSVLLCTTGIVTVYETTAALCRIRRAYIQICHIGRAWQPSPTQNGSSVQRLAARYKSSA